MKLSFVAYKLITLSGYEIKFQVMYGSTTFSVLMM